MELSNYIEHTLLKAEATEADIIQLCYEAKKYNFFGVCINPCWIEVAKKELENSPIKIITVVGFPLGASRTEVKILETEFAVASGADEIDMVMNIGALKSENYELVQQDIEAVIRAAERKPVKVIIETSALLNREKVKACEIISHAGAHYVKTSTGYGKSGASVDDVNLIRESLPKNIGIKASGGIRDKQVALDLINAGATRIGTSSGISMMEIKY